MEQHPHLVLLVMRPDGARGEAVIYDQVCCQSDDGVQRRYIAVKCGDVFHLHVHNSAKSESYGVTINVDGKGIGSHWKIGPNQTQCCRAVSRLNGFVQRYDLVFTLSQQLSSPANDGATSETEHKLGTIELVAKKLVLATRHSPTKRKVRSITNSSSVGTRMFTLPFKPAAKRDPVDGKKFWQSTELTVGVGPARGPARAIPATRHESDYGVFGPAEIVTVVYYCTADALQLRLDNALSTPAAEKDDGPPSLEPESNDSRAKRAKLERLQPVG